MIIQKFGTERAENLDEKKLWAIISDLLKYIITNVLKMLRH